MQRAVTVQHDAAQGENVATEKQGGPVLCNSVPEGLPKIARCFNTGQSGDVARAQALLRHEHREAWLHREAELQE